MTLGVEMKVFIAQLNPIVGDLKNNTDKIIASIKRAKKEKADIVLFSELTICGYPPEDLLMHPCFISDMEQQLQRIIEASDDLMVVVGVVRENPVKKGKPIFNSAAIIVDKKLIGYKDKTLLPTYDIFNETRYFEPGDDQVVIEYKGKRVGVLICEDIWQHGETVTATKYDRDPILEIKEKKPDILLNLSASPYYYEKQKVRNDVCSLACKTLDCPMAYCNQVGANDDLVFDGYSLCFNAKGEIIQLAKGFEEDEILIDFAKDLNEVECTENAISDLYKALVMGVKDYFQKQGFKKALLGLSGGVDSALVLCVAVEALGAKNILTINMPTRYSTPAGMDEAKSLAKNLGVEYKSIPIDETFQSFLNLLNPIFSGRKEDITEENLQARIRGIILMALSNKFGYLVLSTGNKSEMAMGYSTLYGDMCGGLGVLIDVSKQQAYALCRYINREKEIIPSNTIDKPPSAELRHDQKDQDSLPAYSIVDGVLKGYVEEHKRIEQIANELSIEKKLVSDLVHKIHLAEYKRRQAPVGIRVTKKAFNRGRNFPIVQNWH